MECGAITADQSNRQARDSTGAASRSGEWAISQEGRFSSVAAAASASPLASRTLNAYRPCWNLSSLRPTEYRCPTPYSTNTKGATLITQLVDSKRLFPGQDVQETTFSLDAVSRFVCNTIDEVITAQQQGGF